MFFQNINYWAVIIAAIIGMATGFVWYAPWAFGTRWSATKRFTEEEMKSRKERPMAPAMIMTAVSVLVQAFVLAIVYNSIITIGFWGIVGAAALLWLGLTVPLKFYDYVFGNETLESFLITIGYGLVSTILMALIIGIWG